MNRGIRRGLVILLVAVSLAGGLVSIRVAADLAKAAAPPSAPPVSLRSLQDQLAAEQARAASLQQQLDDLVGVTGDLTAALDSTEDQVSADGLSAAELRDRLKAAEARLAKVTKLLRKAADKLKSLGVAGPTVPPTSKPATGGSNAGSTAAPTAKPTPRPTAAPTSASSGFALTLRVTGGDVAASWTACGVSGFDGYALVRSTDPEIHFPPEDRDTLVASLSPAVKAATDASAPSGKLWYRVYCVVDQGGEAKSVATTSTISVTVP